MKLTILLQKEEEKEEEEQARKKESGMDQEDLALKEMIIPTAKEAQDLAKGKTLEKQEELCKISRALAVLASASVRIEITLVPFFQKVFSFQLFFFLKCCTYLLTCHATNAGSRSVGSVKSF